MGTLFYVLSFLSGIILVEFVGYFWHRWVEHKEVLGKSIAFRHYKHHEVQYPVNKLRTNGPYESADSWTWYTVGILTTICAFVILPVWYAYTFQVGRESFDTRLAVHIFYGNTNGFKS